MVADWFARFFALSGLDQLYVALWVATGVLLTVSVAFGLITVHLRLRNNRKARRWEALEASWVPVLLDVLGGAASSESLHALVGESDRLFFLAFLVRYSRRLRGEERRLVQALAHPYLPDLKRRLTGGTAEARARALGTLAEVGMPEHAGAVAEALDDPSPLVAMIAARSLFVQGSLEFFPRVLARVHRFEPWSRGFLAGMLASGGPAAAPLLRDLLADPQKDPVLRAVAAAALEKLNDIEAAEVAARILERADDPELIAACLRLLARLGHGVHLERVRPWLTSSDQAVRISAVAAVAELGGQNEVEVLEEYVNDPSAWVALQAARGLLGLGERDALLRLAASQRRGAGVALQVLGE